LGACRGTGGSFFCLCFFPRRMASDWRLGVPDWFITERAPLYPPEKNRFPVFGQGQAHPRHLLLLILLALAPFLTGSWLSGARGICFHYGLAPVPFSRIPALQMFQYGFIRHFIFLSHRFPTTSVRVFFFFPLHFRGPLPNALVTVTKRRKRYNIWRSFVGVFRHSFDRRLLKEKEF